MNKIKSILAFAALMLCGGAWATTIITPKALLNFYANSDKQGDSLEVEGWYNYSTYNSVFNNFEGQNGVTVSVENLLGNFRFDLGSPVDGDFQQGEYLDVHGVSHQTVAAEIAASLGLDADLPTDVYKTGLIQGAKTGNVATIAGLTSGKKYLVYLGFGRKNGDTYVNGVELAATGYESIGSMEYVASIASNDGHTEAATQYKPFELNTQMYAAAGGLMVVRLNNVVPTSQGQIKFTMRGTTSGINFIAVSEVIEPIYYNQLAGSETVPAGTYGAITIEESTGGYKATSYSSNTGLSGTGVGSFAAAGSTKNGRKMIDTHTIAGWFKVDALPTGDATKDIFVMRTGTDSYNGYKVAVDANGVLKIGRTNYNNGNYSWNDNKRVSLTGASGAVASGTWFHLAIAFTYDSNGSYWHLTPVAWINGVAAEKSGDEYIDINLNGPGYVDDIRIGANISAAGVYLSPMAYSSADVIKAIATDPTYVRAANSVVRATLSEDANFSEISWVGDVAPKAGDAAEITLDANVVLTIDAAIAADSVKVIGTDKILTLSGSSLDATNFAKFDFSAMTGKVVFSEDCTLIPATGPANGVVYRFEKDYLSGFTLNQGAGTYEFKNVKTTNGIGSAYKIKVNEGDSIELTNSSWNDLRCGVSLEVAGGDVKIGKAEGNSAIWWGDGATTLNQTGGTITGTATGSAQSGTGNGFLLGYSGNGITQFNVSGGTFQVLNSSLQSYLCNTVNISGTGVMKAKGVFNGHNTTTFNVATGGAFELGSLGWKDCPLTLNGGTFKAYETTTMAGAITVSAPSTIEVENGTVLTVTGTITGSSRDNKITKTGEGTLALGEQRPVLDVVTGKVRLTATSDELATGELVLPIPANASAVADTKVEVYNANGDQMTITGVSANAEGTQVTVTLQVNEAITESCNISDKVTDSTTGVVLIQGPTGESDPITINFDRADYPQGVSFQVTGNVAFTGTVPTTIISYDAAVVYVMSPMTFSVPTGVTAIVKGTVNGDVSLSGTGTIKAADGAVVNGNLNVTGNKFTLEGNLTLGGTGDSHIKGLTGGKLIKTGSGYLKLNNGTGNGHDGYDRYAIDGTVIQIDAGMVKVYNENGDARMYNPSFVIGTDGRLENYGWIGAKGTLTIENDTDKVIFTNTNGYGEGGKSAELWGAPNIVKKGAGKATLCVGSHTGNGAEPFGTVNVQAGTLAFDSTVAAAMGAVSGNGKVEMKNTTVDFNVNNQTSGLTSHFIAASGTNTMKWKGGAGNGYNQLCSTDTKADPVITINSGATLNVYGHDYSGWNGNLNEHGWLINNGILVFQSESGTRFFRDHIVFGNGATMKIDHAGTPLLLYGGTGAETSSQFMLESGTASIVAGQAGDNAFLHLGNNTSGGYGDRGIGVSVGDAAVLTIDVPVKGNSGDPITKWGPGTLKFNKAMNQLGGTIQLKDGSVAIHSDCNLGENKVVCADVNKKLVVSDVDADGYTTYSLAQRDATDVYLKYENSAYKYVLSNNAEVTLIDGDVIVVDVTYYGSDPLWHLGEYKAFPSEFAGHTLKIDSNSNLKAAIPENQTVEINANVYHYSHVGAGAQISGTGTLYLGYTEGGSTIGAGTVINCAVALGSDTSVKGATINGAVTFGGTTSAEEDKVFTLAEGATLTMKTNLADGKVVSGVDTKVVKKVVNEGEPTTYTYSLVDASSDKPITPDAGEVVIPVVPETGIAIQPGADVVVPTATASDKIKVVYGGVELSKAEGGRPKYVNVTVNSTTGAIELEATEDAKPTVSAMAMPTTHEGDQVSLTITPIPGLFYSIVMCDTPNGTFTGGDGEQATTGEAKTLSIAMPDAQVKFFKVCVKATK